MPGFVRIGDMSAGHDDYPPSPLVYTPVTRTYFNGKLLGVNGGQYASHTDSDGNTHPQSSRIINAASNTTYFEGQPVAVIGDAITDGDVCAQCSEDSFGL